ncbi:hypothetical protein D3C84_395960 [compost metagenome]
MLQLRIGEVVHLRPHSPQQRRPIPLQRSFKGVAPGAKLVVAQDRLIGLGIAGMFDPPFLQCRVEGFFVDIAFVSNVGLVTDLILPQGIRLEPIERDTALVGCQIGLPQPRLTKRRGDPGHAVDEPRVGDWRCLARDRPQHGHESDVLQDRPEVAPGLLRISLLPCLHPLVNLVGQLQGGDGQHDLAQARHEKGRHVQHAQAQFGIVFEPGNPGLVVYLGGGYCQQPGIGLHSGQMELMTGCKHFAVNEGFIHSQVDLLVPNLDIGAIAERIRVIRRARINRGRIPFLDLELAPEPLEKAARLVLCDKTGEEPLITGGTQLDRKVTGELEA